MAGGGGADSRWLITYGDLVTLLMAFFIALYGISHADSKKFNDFLKGLGAFGNPAAANSGILKGGPSIVGVGTGVGQAQPGSVSVGSNQGASSVVCWPNARSTAAYHRASFEPKRWWMRLWLTPSSRLSVRTETPS